MVECCSGEVAAIWSEKMLIPSSRVTGTLSFQRRKLRAKSLVSLLMENEWSLSGPGTSTQCSTSFLLRELESDPYLSLGFLGWLFLITALYMVIVLNWEGGTLFYPVGLLAEHPREGFAPFSFSMVCPSRSKGWSVCQLALLF